MNDKSKKSPLKPVSNLLSRFNLVIFIVVVASGLIAAILIINNILNIPYGANNSTAPKSGSLVLDQTTIDRINKLKTSDENTGQTLPSGRINPFN